MLLASCDLFNKKNNEFKHYKKALNGKIVEHTNSNGINNVSVYIQKSTAGTDYFIIDSTKSNINGAFSFNFDYSNESSYKLTIFSKDYYTDATHLVVEDQTQNLEIKLQPLSYILFKIKNVAPALINDELNFSLQMNYFSGWRFKGSNIDSDLLVRVPSQIPIKFTFNDKSLTKDSIFSKEYQLNSNEVINELIEY